MIVSFAFIFLSMQDFIAELQMEYSGIEISLCKETSLNEGLN